MAATENLTVRCNDCKAPLLTVWGALPDSAEVAGGMVPWRTHALESHRRAKPECIASGATIQPGWPSERPS